MLVTNAVSGRSWAQQGRHFGARMQKGVDLTGLLDRGTWKEILPCGGLAHPTI
jgi:hypothetical protein